MNKEVRQLGRIEQLLGLKKSYNRVSNRLTAREEARFYREPTSPYSCEDSAALVYSQVTQEQRTAGGIS